MNHLTKIFFPDSWTFMRHLIVFTGIFVLICGIVMTLKGISGGGVINLKTAVFEGKLETGTIGLLFSFLGFALLLFCLWSRVTSKINVKKSADGSITVVHKGVFDKGKAENIAKVLGIDS